jgi:murein DD-endopeptidase MepM/ murein hydrolase activator NlpD
MIRTTLIAMATALVLSPCAPIAVQAQELNTPNWTDGLLPLPLPASALPPALPESSDITESTLKALPTFLPTAVPLQGAVNSGFGWRADPFHGQPRFHHGADIPAPQGAPIVAAADGTVLYSGPWGGYGNVVILGHNGQVQTLYAHTSLVLVQPGQWVAQAQPIALVGKTGHATGPHLHFEVRVNGQTQDPLGFLGQVHTLANTMANTSPTAPASSSPAILDPSPYLVAIPGTSVPVPPPLAPPLDALLAAYHLPPQLAITTSMVANHIPQDFSETPRLRAKPPGALLPSQQP